MSITYHAKYTVVLNELLKDPETKSVIDKALSHYPLYEGKKKYDLIPTREELNKRLLNHYKYREIGFESPGRFIDELEIVMGEIMPYYNEMFKTIEIMADLENPFDNVDVVEKIKETITGVRNDVSAGYTKTDSETGNTNTTTGTTTLAKGTTETVKGTHTNKDVNSQTPSNKVGLIKEEDINSVTYADNISWNKNTIDDTTTTGGTDITSIGETVENNGSVGTTNNSIEGSAGIKTDVRLNTYTKKGNQGVNTYAHDMNEFRTSIIDVVDNIINNDRVAELFMLVY